MPYSRMALMTLTACNKLLLARMKIRRVRKRVDFILRHADPLLHEIPDLGRRQIQASAIEASGAIISRDGRPSALAN